MASEAWAECGRSAIAVAGTGVLDERSCAGIAGSPCAAPEPEQVLESLSDNVQGKGGSTYVSTIP